MATRRGATRLRYGRLAAAGSALMVTLVAVLGGVGLLLEAATTRLVADQAALSAAPARTQQEDRSTSSDRSDSARTGARFTQQDFSRSARASRELAVPADSGEGRRIVFDRGAQRVWLVGEAGRVQRTYLVSGSLSDNLDRGTYGVWSRSLQAWGIDDSGSMRFMVRFAHGERAAIGFHDIPVKDGRFVQTRADLGAPQSHGCIRQWRPDARALWHFSPLGTPVVVV